MTKLVRNSLIAFVLLPVSGLAAPGAGWPARIFAPYMYIGADDGFQITQCDDACGQNFIPSPLSSAVRRGSRNGTGDSRWGKTDTPGKLKPFGIVAGM